MNFFNVKEATDILKEKSLVKDINGTRRFIRMGELPATKETNHNGYQIDKEALEMFVWVKTSNTSDIVNQMLAVQSKTSAKLLPRQYNVASFFAGIGGFDLGLEAAGMDVVFQCEINKFSQKVLKSHWPDTPLFHDITQLTSDDIPDSNVWCGGFPCQDLSLANQGKRKGLKGERSGLFYQYSELIRAKKPDWVIIENVPGLLNSHAGEDFRILIEKMDELGYGVSWRVLDAKYFGTPQRRRRVYIVASLGDMRSAEVLFERGATSITDKQGEGKRQRAAGRDDGGLSESNVYSIQHAGIGRKHTAGPQAKGYRNDGETYTLDSRGSSDAVCSKDAPYRVREVAGLPSGMDSNRYRALGNAVAVPIVRWLGERIVAVDKEYGIK